MDPEKSRRAGIDLPPPPKGKTSEKTRQRAYTAGQSEPNKPVNRKHSKATIAALQREGTDAASHNALAQHARQAAKQRTPAERSASARKAAKTRRANPARVVKSSKR